MIDPKRQNNAIIILAAGKGTRMKSAIPKIFHKIASHSMIELVLMTIKKAKAKNIIIVVSDETVNIKNIIKPSNNIKFVNQKERLGTGHAVQLACKELPEDIDIVSIIYADTPFIKNTTINNLEGLITQGNQAAVLGFEPIGDNAYGRLIISGNKLLEIVEYNEATSEQRKIKLCNSGIMSFDSTILRQYISKIDNKNSKGEYYLTDLISLLTQDQHNVGNITTDETEVMGINSISELIKANKVQQKKLRDAAIEDSVNMIDPNTVYLAADTKFGNGVTIEPNVYFGKDVTIADNVTIKAFSYLEGCNISEDSVIGPFARIRPKTNIAARSKIGNFVEIKNADIDAETKINHLSYIGDAKLGKKVNIGAGTITCNYDGYNKYQTNIEDKVFIGSNNALIAPVTIQESAITAAGSVITKNVPDNAMAVARAKQENIKDQAKIFRKRNHKK
jgi:bifunctional UDP-N-acetylglucosamine pyrophosphorylase / glucosamine-1-phosphate N-acetyltransferase